MGGKSGRNGLSTVDILFSDRLLEQFVDRCEAENITFVATEWGLPHIATLARDERVNLIYVS